jgi:hypothetical protein
VAPAWVSKLKILETYTAGNSTFAQTKAQVLLTRAGATPRPGLDRNISGRTAVVQMTLKNQSNS